MIFKVPSQESKHGPAPQCVSWQRGKTGFYEGNSRSREPAWTMAHLSSRDRGVGVIGILCLVSRSTQPPGFPFLALTEKFKLGH